MDDVAQTPGLDTALTVATVMHCRVAVLVPCRNEAASVARVVRDFRAALPDCAVYVYDNGSTDGTGELARLAGAIVRREERPGRGKLSVVMFCRCE